MAHRQMNLSVLSAKGLKTALFSTKDVYVQAFLAGDPRMTKQETPVDKDGGANPTWLFPMIFLIDEAAAQQNRLILVFRILSKWSLGEKEVGEVCVPVKELIDNFRYGQSAHFVSYEVRKPSGKHKGELNFSYEFGQVNGALTTQMAVEPVTGYPAPMATTVPYILPGSSGAAGYPQPLPGLVVGFPQPVPGCGYGVPSVYGYPPPPVQQQPNMNQIGMGGRDGFIQGVLRGLSVGGMLLDPFGN